MAPGRARVSTFVACQNAEAVAEFARTVFGATDVNPPLRRSDGSLWNAELEIGGSTVMVSEAPGDMARPAFLYVHVADVHDTFARALAAGATEVMPPELRFYGDEDGGVADMAGNWWWIATHRETLSPDQVQRAARQEEQRRETQQ